jgi:hypothetical protein
LGDISFGDTQEGLVWREHDQMVREGEGKEREETVKGVPAQGFIIGFF